MNGLASGTRRRIVVAITGASGAIYGIRLLEVLAQLGDVETHLVLSSAARTTITRETTLTVAGVKHMADVVHHERDLAAPISSGSFRVDGMVVAPCSVKTLSAIANCYSDSLVSRAADVVLKERRRLVLLLRETPLHVGHIRLMEGAATAGAVIFPPVPAFYYRPQTLADVIDQTIARVLDQFDIDTNLFSRWPEDPSFCVGNGTIVEDESTVRPTTEPLL